MIELDAVICLSVVTGARLIWEDRTLDAPSITNINKTLIQLLCASFRQLEGFHLKMIKDPIKLKRSNHEFLRAEGRSSQNKSRQE